MDQAWPRFFVLFWCQKFPIWWYQALSSNLGLSEQRGAPTDTGEFWGKLCKFETVKCGFEEREVSICLQNIGTVSVFLLAWDSLRYAGHHFQSLYCTLLQSIEVVDRHFLPDTSMDMAFLCISQSWNVLVFFGFLHIVLKCCWAASVIIPCASCSLPQGGGSMMSIFRSSSDMWCHKSFAQHFRVAAVGLGMCVILWHQCRPLQGTGNSHMHCAMRSVMFYHGRSEATIPFWPPFFSCFK